MPKRFLGCLLRGKRLLVRRVPALNPESPQMWFFALGCALDSACLLWPAGEGVLDGTMRSR